jgi:hypothetical protein
VCALASHQDEETHSTVTHIHVLTSDDSNVAWKSLKSPAEVSSSVSIADAENDTLASFRGLGKNAAGRNDESNARSVKLRRKVWGEG